MLGSVDSKPTFLFDKALEPTIKAIVRKFPTVDTKSGSVCTIIIHKSNAEVTPLNPSDVSCHFSIRTIYEVIN